MVPSQPQFFRYSRHAARASTANPRVVRMIIDEMQNLQLENSLGPLLTRANEGAKLAATSS